MRSAGAIGCAAVLAALGCARASAPAIPLDGAGDAAAAGVDAGPPDGNWRGFWDVCELGSECASTLCWRPRPSDEVGHCTHVCDGVCPDGFACRSVPVGDVEMPLCVPAEETLCLPCDDNASCGDSSDLCIPLTAGRFCSIDCQADPTVCPAGFTCQQIASGGDLPLAWQCKPLNGVCCVDGDGDLRGLGSGCVAGDCDDGNPAVHDDAIEVCDGLDNDCVGGVDVDVTDCATATCLLGAFGYFERPAEPCAAGACAPQAAVECGLYTCDGGGEAGDRCALACDGEDDAKCVPPAHCDASACVADLPNGSPCDEASDCATGHCQNGFCCNGGDCCTAATDCPTYGTNAPICENPATCQGSRGEPDCVAFACTALAGTADDSACTAATFASDCGFYRARLCTGAVDQLPPACPTSCTAHADCDPEGFCDLGDTFTCKGDLENGQACGDDAARCRSGHCQNGHCCDAGDCCAAAGDCPATYSNPPTCSLPIACQGERDAAACSASRCVTLTGLPDDSACTPDVEASGCGPYAAVRCTGAATQTAPACPETCAGDSTCDAAAYCDAAGHCIPDELDGRPCLDDGECASGHCQNGFCCASGDCCAYASDCAALAEAAVCDSQASCQGHRVVGSCSATKQCLAVTVDDDSACAGLQANDCGMYPAVACTSAQDQPPDPAARCTTSCDDDTGCDPSAHCSAHACLPDAGPGGYCTVPGDCTSGLFCVDNVCCGSSCPGTCQACDVPGHEGTCWNVPDGQDPDGECGAVSCAAYYWGWVGDSCYRKADLAAAEAACGGDGACRTIAEECAARTVQGGVDLTCDALCQNPTVGTCTTLTEGACTNVSAGSLTCGLGPCQVTVPRCVAGSPNACVPNSGASTPEVCDYADNDCDGAVDDGFDLQTDEANCGACGNGCTNPHGTTTCVGGACDPSCSSGYLSCDGDPDDGCEALKNDDPSCTSTTFFLGEVSGDTGAEILQDSWVDEEWDSFKVTEDNDWDTYLSATVELYNPPGVDFDLCLYCYECGGTLIGCSAKAAGQTDVVSYRREDGWGSNDDRHVIVQVKYWSASVCDAWTLRVVGNTDVGTTTCE